jgi:hypothetical protein
MSYYNAKSPKKTGKIDKIKTKINYFKDFSIKVLTNETKINIIKVQIKNINKGGGKMTKYEVLTKLQDKEINKKKAYRLLYKPYKERKPKRAGFVKIKVRVPDEKAANILLGIILFLPLPIFLIKWILLKRFKNQEHISEQFPMAPGELIDLISMRGVRVNINTKTKERILIKTI